MIEKLKLIILLLTVFFCIESIAANKFFDDHFNDFTEDLETAKEEGKQGIFLFFHLSDCPFCDKMRKTVLSQEHVRDYFKKHFLSFEVDVEGDLEIVDFKGNDTIEKDFAFKHNRVKATPVLAFFDLNGKRVVRRTGFANEKEFMLLAKYVVDKVYLNENFVRYKRKHLYR